MNGIPVEFTDLFGTKNMEEILIGTPFQCEALNGLRGCGRFLLTIENRRYLVDRATLILVIVQFGNRPAS